MNKELPTSGVPAHLLSLSRDQLEILNRLVSNDDFRFFVDIVLGSEYKTILEDIAKRPATGCSGNFSDTDNITLGEKRGQLNFIKYLQTLGLGLKKTAEVKQKLTTKE